MQGMAAAVYTACRAIPERQRVQGTAVQRTAVRQQHMHKVRDPLPGLTGLSLSVY